VARSRLTRFTTAVAAATAAVLALAGCQGGEPGSTTASGDTLTIGLTYTPNVQFAPFYVAEELGYFDEAGVNVELRHHGESEDLFGALKSGTEQLVYAGGDEITQAVAGGVDMQSVATLYNPYPAVLIVPDDSEIESAADLKGHSVGVPGLYGQTYFALLAMLADAGLTDADVDIQAIGYTQQAALTGDRVDAVMGFANNDAVQFEASGYAIRTIEAVDPEHPNLVGPAVSADAATIADRGDDIAAVLEAVDRAIEYIEQNPEEAVEITANYVPTLGSDEAKAQALATLEATIPLLAPLADQPLLTNNPDTWAAMAEFMHSAGLIDTEVDAESLYTNEFVPGE
jgi:NitT/TauT family transport system substrate-binding protein